MSPRLSAFGPVLTLRPTPGRVRSWRESGPKRDREVTAVFDPKRPFGLMNSQPYLIFGAASVRGGGLRSGSAVIICRLIAPLHLSRPGRFG
jgi:hypothetical protein